MDRLDVQYVSVTDVTSSPQLQLSIVLPAYNEEQAVAQVLGDLVEVMSVEDIAFEIVIVDDASTDETVSRARQFADTCSPGLIRIIESTHNGGAGSARKRGIRAAHGEIVVMLDVDGSYPAEAIPRLLEYFPAYDQVNGARTCERGSMPWLRGPAKWLIRQLACYLAGHRIPDLNTGLKAFRRDVMLDWLWVVPDGFSCVTTMTLAFLTNGYAVKYVPVDYRPRIGRSKFHPIKDTLSYLSTVLRIVLYFRPLRVFLPLAGAVISAGAVKSAASLAWTGSMQESDVILLVCGFMTCMLGLLAEVVVAHHRR